MTIIQSKDVIIGIQTRSVGDSTGNALGLVGPTGSGFTVVNDVNGNATGLVGANGTPVSFATNPMTTAGDIIIGGASGAEQRLAIGTTGEVLTVSAGAPAWAAGLTNPMTTSGDIIIGGTGGAAQRLGIGSTGNILTVSAGAPAWTAAPATLTGPPVNAQTGTTYTLALTDAPATALNQGIVTMNNGSASTLTIPANSSVAFPVGTIIQAVQLGAGQLTIAITTDTLLNASSVTARAQNSTLVLTKIATTTWVLSGDNT